MKLTYTASFDKVGCVFGNVRPRKNIGNSGPGNGKNLGDLGKCELSACLSGAGSITTGCSVPCDLTNVYKISSSEASVLAKTRLYAASL